MPLHDGAIWRDHGDEVEILRLAVDGETLRLTIREQQLSMIFAARNAYGRHQSYPWVLVLANPVSKEAILLNRNTSPMAYQGVGWLSPFLRGQETFDLHLRQALGGDLAPGTAKDWLENGQLVVVRKRNLGSRRIHQTVTTEHPLTSL